MIPPLSLDSLAPLGALAPTLVAIASAAIKGAVFVALAAAAAHTLRHRSAAARHAVWTAALAAHLVLALAAPLLPSWSLPVFRMPAWLATTADASSPQGVGPIGGAPQGRGPAGRTLVVSNPRVEGSTRLGDRMILTVDDGRTNIVATASASARFPMIVSEAAPTTPQAHKFTSLISIWLAGLLLVLLRLALGTARVSRLARAGDRVEDGHWLSLAQRTAKRLGIARPLTLMRGDRLDVPVTWGVVYPVVLLPQESVEWSEDRRRFVLVHEMAHVKRFDALTQLVAQLAVALFWFDPLVWLAARRMRAEREHACDDYVLRDGTLPSLYADELLHMVRRLGSTSRSEAAAPAFAALAMARRSEFEGRMLAILDPVADRHTLSRAGSVAGALLTLVLLVPLAALRPFEERAVAHGATPALAAPGAFAASEAPITVPLTLPVERRPGAGASRATASTVKSKAVVAGAALLAKARSTYQCTEAEIRRKGSGYHLSSDVRTNGDKMLMYSTHKAGRCIRVFVVGDFALTSDERDIARLAPGGRAQFHELTPARERELTIVRDDDGVLRRTYMENGRLATYDGSAQEWVASLVQEIARENATDAPARVARFRARGGVPAVLAEIASIRSGGAKRKHYEALLISGSLSPTQVDSVVRHAGRELADNSGDLRAVLRLVPPGGVRAVNAALEEAIGRMSDGDKTEILASMLQTTDPATLAVVLRLAERIGSDGDKATLLRRAAPRVLDGSSDALREAFFRAYATMGSDGDKQSVLVAVLRQGRASAALTRDVIRGAGRIGSDGDKAAVLLAVVRNRLVTTPELREEYIRTARTIGSDGDYRAVIDAVLAKPAG